MTIMVPSSLSGRIGAKPGEGSCLLEKIEIVSEGLKGEENIAAISRKEDYKGDNIATTGFNRI